MNEYVAFLRKRADECGPGLRKFFRFFVIRG